MKICFIAPSGNYHTIKWVNWFSKRGHDVHVISFMPDKIEGSTVHFIDAGVTVKDSDFKKIKYLLQAKKVKRIVDEIQPDIVNAHYATSYGAVTALSGIKNYILSVWGSDIYDFPNKSFMHKMILKYSLSRATHLFSTSKVMATEGKKYTNKKFDITPFGVDMELFNPNKKCRDSHPKNEFLIGTVKAIDPKYGIDYIIKAVKLVVDKRPDIPLKVRIAGRGEYEEEYKQLASSLGVGEKISWLGFISQKDAAEEWANMDVAVIPSTLESESFGVSAVEAEACGTALIISDVPGLMEATYPGKSCMVVPRKSEDSLAEAIIYLYDNPNKRVEMGYAGRLFVRSVYDITRCFKKAHALFQKYGGVLRNHDLTLYSPFSRTRRMAFDDDGTFVLGTIKGLKSVYGIDTLLYAVRKVIDKRPNIVIRVRIAGRGSQEDELYSLTQKLHLENIVQWLGFISQENAAKEWANFDLAVIPSRKESFGVSAIEAIACETDIIISSAKGLTEVTEHILEDNSIFEADDADELCELILRKYDLKLRRFVGNNEYRNLIKKKYEINKCFEVVENLYCQYERNRSL